MSIFDATFGNSAAESQTADEKALAAYIKRKIDETRTASNRIAHEGVWMTNVAYLLGFDSVYYDTASRQFRSTDGAGRVGLRRNRVFENLILPAVQNRQARLCKVPPRFEVRPEDNTNEAKEAARLALEVLLQLWDDCNVNTKRLPLTMWVQECGHAYMKVSFDDQKGRPLKDPLTGKILGYEGEVLVEPVSAFEMFPDPLAQTMEEAQWIVQAKVRKLDYFKTHYPERGHMVKEEGAWLLSIQYEQRIQTMSNLGGMGSAANQMMMENAAIELSYYEKRSRKHPNGRHVIVANGIILKDAELPFGEIPFAKFDDILIAGKYYSEATITHARPLQDQYNRTLTRRAMWVNRLLAGKYIAARGHGLAQESLDDQSGELIEFDPVPNAAEPHAVQIPSMPEYAYRETDELKAGLNQIFGLSDVARGIIPAAGIPAIGMQLLLEQDETRIGIEVEQHEHAYARMGMLMLKCAAKCFKTPRNLIQRGVNNTMNIRQFSGEDLPSEPDVKVVRGSTVPTSTSVRRQEIINAMQLGLLGNPQDPLVQEKVLEMMEFGNSAELWQDAALDSAQAKREIDSIESGAIPNIHLYDNHPFLIKKLNNYRKSDKCQDGPPEWALLVDEAIKIHGQYQLQLQNPEVAQMKQNVADGFSPDGQPLVGDMGPVAEEPVLEENNNQPMAFEPQGV